MGLEGIITHLQRFSLDDGPGIRTTVFFKGCNLACAWCHNPENISREKQLKFNRVTCTGCGLCRKVCPQQVHSFQGETHLLNREKCDFCGACLQVCPTASLQVIYASYSPEQLMEEIMKDSSYYRQSEGGVTFSGGEPLLQLDFLAVMLDKCQKAGIHTAVDTAVNVPFNYLERILDKTDLFLIDYKLADELKHREATGVTNSLIYENIIKLSELSVNIWLRIPIIPSYHNLEEIAAIAKKLGKLNNIIRIELLPYHRYGLSKYEALGKPYLLPDEVVPDRELLEKMAECLKACCKTVVIGS